MGVGLLEEPKVSGISIVLLGNFNPRIFNPDWFVRYGLLSPQEAENADVAIIHQQIAKFQAAWLSLQTDAVKFNAGTTEAPYHRLKDLVLKAFSDFLPHTPIKQMGINKQVHFEVPSQSVRDKIGFELAPPEAWGEWGEHIRAEDEKKHHGGMTLLTMRQLQTNDRPSGFTNATIRPSEHPNVDRRTGIFIEVNDHYEASEQENIDGCEEILTLLDSCFDASLDRANWIINQIMAKAK